LSVSLADLRSLGLISPLDHHFAVRLAKLAGDERSPLLLASALASRALTAGHVCADLPAVCEHGVIGEEGGVGAEALPEWSEWLEALGESPLVARVAGDLARPAPGNGPLVLDAAGRLYLRRSFASQATLAAGLRERVAAPDLEIDEGLLRDGLRRLFASAAESSEDFPSIDWQCVAAASSVLRPFCVISGGPGTGKTFTVVKVLALVIEQVLASGRPPPEILLLAPTGKAAAALAASVSRARAGLDVSGEVRDAIPEEAGTIHRALGAIFSPRARPSTGGLRGEGTPRLPADLVVVDEASMVDLELMSRLVSAVRPDARLVLLGDPNQLASIDAGAVLSDICGERSESGQGEPEPMNSRVRGLLPLSAGGDEIVAAAGAGEDISRGMTDSLVRLRTSHRFGEGTGIGRLAEAIRVGDADLALELLADPELPEISLGSPAASGPAAREVRDRAVDEFCEIMKEGDLARRLTALSGFRVLCAHRRGPGGAEAVNDAIEVALEAAALIHPETVHYPGRLVLVTRNDPGLGLFNGDIGLIAETERGLRACFAARTADTGIDGTRQISPHRLPPHETVFAMSVHKSQGSEFADVLFLLPERPSPILTRELIYTAVSRARRTLSIRGDPELVRLAIARRTERASGLRDALWSDAGEA